MAVGVPAYGSPRPRQDLSRLRLVWLLALALLMAGVIEARLAYWQVVQHRQLQNAAEEQYSKQVGLPASRGVILDRNLRPLAVNTTVYSVFLSPDQVPVEARERVAVSLGSVLGVPPGDVMALLQSDRKFGYVARRQTLAKAEQLRALKLPGVGLQAEEQRSYLPGGIPGTTLAANLIGFVNYDGAGQRGVEEFYNARLAGKPGYMTTYRDLANREIVLGTRTRVDPVNGQSLVLTLDSGIQYLAEQAIADGVKAAKAESGTVLIMDPHTGGILAWADYPSYDANAFPRTDPNLFSDPAVSYLFEPGSVMKVVTLAGAIDSGAITPGTVINDPGYAVVGGYRISDWDRRNHGSITYTYVLEHSLNVGAIKAMQAEGEPAFYHYLQAFGLTGPSGVDVAAEASMPLEASKMGAAQYATAAFGQGIGVNAVQMLAAINVVANGGRYAQPHVVERAGGAPTPLAATAQRQAVSATSARQMTQMMESVVQHGSGWTARVKGFELDQTGKTGTAQIPVNGRYTDDVWASYVGFLPSDNPRFTMLVVIRKPHNDYWMHNDGYYVAAPVWKRLAEAMVLQWRITPDPR